MLRQAQHDNGRTATRQYTAVTLSPSKGALEVSPCFDKLMLRQAHWCTMRSAGIAKAGVLAKPFVTTAQQASRLTARMRTAA